jgi:hypothetical protein
LYHNKILHVAASKCLLSQQQLEDVVDSFNIPSSYLANDPLAPHQNCPHPQNRPLLESHRKLLLTGMVSAIYCPVMNSPVTCRFNFNECSPLFVIEVQVISGMRHDAHKQVRNMEASTIVYMEEHQHRKNLLTLLSTYVRYILPAQVIFGWSTPTKYPAIQLHLENLA